MLFKKNNFSQQRKQSFYEKEISRILYWLIKEYQLPSFSLSYCQLSSRGENAKIYLSFAQDKNQEKTLTLLNKKYSQIIKKEIAQDKNFAYIPNLYFFVDKELEAINNLEKILEKTSSDHEN
ncbi:MAG: ribosome-binding factor A [Spiroplasmataceae bacterium]|jgi:ribosome-binding factor A|nr:ribosome-binding factor A [Spiroplasmataceae bacterium]